MEATRQARLSHGMTNEGVQFLWKGNIHPEEPCLDLEAYAQSCVLKLRDAWQELHELIRRTMAEAADPAGVEPIQEHRLDTDEGSDTPPTGEAELRAP